MHSLSWVLIRRRRHLRCPPGWTRNRIWRREYFNRCTTLRRYVVRTTYRRSDVQLSLAELEPLPRSRAARLLALDHPRISRQQSLLPQLLAVSLVRQAQRPRNRETHRPRLPRHPAAPTQRPHVERAERVGRRERLLDVRHERRPGEVIAQGALVDVPLARAGGQVHPRHAHLATPDRVPAQLRCDRRHAVAESTSGCGCCAACGCVGPAYTLSICFTF